MLTPEIKTNLILKEIGIQRYSLRSQGKIISQKTYHYFLKGKILAIFDKPFENFVREQQDLIKAVLTSTKLDQGEEIFENAFFDSQESLQQKISSFNDIKLAIVFGKISYNLSFDCEVIYSPSVNQLMLQKNLKANLWKDIKKKLNVESFSTQKEGFIVKRGNDIYDRFYSEIYDDLVYAPQKNSYEIEQLMELTNINSNSYVLDVGSGTGHHVHMLTSKNIN